MIINRQLQIALLISFIWHLLLVSSVSIVFLPGSFKLQQYPSVIFLGSILSSPITFGVKQPLQKEQLFQFPPEIDISRENYFSKRPYISLSLEKKTVNPDILIDVDAPRQKMLFAKKIILEKESRQAREIIFQPPMPEYPEWTNSQQLQVGLAVFKIYITACGLVQQITNVKVSGNPEIDAALARYIRKWRFAPTCGLQGNWQIVKINYDAHR